MLNPLVLVGATYAAMLQTGIGTTEQRRENDGLAGGDSRKRDKVDGDIRHLMPHLQCLLPCCQQRVHEALGLTLESRSEVHAGIGREEVPKGDHVIVVNRHAVATQSVRNGESHSIRQRRNDFLVAYQVSVPFNNQWSWR